MISIRLVPSRVAFADPLSHTKSNASTVSAQLPACVVLPNDARWGAQAAHHAVFASKVVHQ